MIWITLLFKIRLNSALIRAYLKDDVHEKKNPNFHAP